MKSSSTCSAKPCWGKPISTCSPAFALQFRENDLRTVELGQPQYLDEQAPHADGPHSYISVKFPLFDSRGRPYALCGISTDITDRKTAEQELLAKNLALQRANEELAATRLQLIHAEKLKCIGTLAAGVAHEVKNPLQILLLGIDDLATSLPQLDGDHSRTLQEMREAVNRADGIIRGLLDFSRLKELQLESADLSEAIRSALRLVHFKLSGARVRVEEEFEDNLPLVSIDPQKMQQVLINLINNALDVMPDGGTLGLRTHSRTCVAADSRAGLGDTAAWRRGDRLVIMEITDTGPGISPDLLPHVFDPFFTTKPTGKGEGLGLAVAQKIVALHGGTINLQNRPEGGVRVTITLRKKVASFL
jgi:signal transduction histidine kinase